VEGWKGICWVPHSPPGDPETTIPHCFADEQGGMGIFSGSPSSVSPKHLQLPGLCCAVLSVTLGSQMAAAFVSSVVLLITTSVPI
jgi:hypothetical protein